MYLMFFPGPRMNMSNFRSSLGLYATDLNSFINFFNNVNNTINFMFGNSSPSDYLAGLFVDDFVDHWQQFCVDCSCLYNNCNVLGSGYSDRNIRPQVWVSLSNSEKAQYNLLLANKRIRFKWKVPVSSVFPLSFDFVLPFADTSSNSSFIDICIHNNSEWYCESNVDWVNVKQGYHDLVNNNGASYLGLQCFQQRSIETYVEPEEPCDDERTSATTQECLITVNGENIIGQPISYQYNLLFQPDADHTSGCLSNISGLTNISKISGVTCRFINGVVRGNGTITIKGTLKGSAVTSELIGGVLTPILEPINEQVTLLSATFDSCCDSPTSWTETYTEALENIFGDSDTFTADLTIDEICWSGFALVTDYCCDDSDCSEIDMTFPDNTTISGGDDGGDGGDGGGGGGDVDITCICDNLEILNNKLDSLITAVNGLSLVCSPTINPPTVTPEITVTPQITVTPCQPVVEIQSITVPAPVVNNTVTPQITVTPCQPVVEIQSITVPAPVVNNTVTPCQPEITVLPCQPTVSVEGPDLTGLIEELHSCFFKSVGDGCEKSITDYIQELVEKDFAPFIDVTISPYDLVNIRRVFRDTDD